ncbi:M3 family metallopeptidase [Rubrimonas cliftonensis]|uniref:Peptidyl-dipeptidase Dcp Metallo peptidase. MEROPS family M03A n=1 Tax=Rubrimonas cliftonensis TaxID=89524 RepID=A0A1H4DV81_9RHOB|nr:M3 family metallopeptidase [Rubrimonas cliftonensis]SEA76651.1 peptidyl-dipeptidase Dcp Metallo peptidase. MEROPS family M03A [Rubrimonas cliftonensis]
MTNPLTTDWTGPFGLPPFGAINPDHFREAFDAGLAQAEAERDAIAADPAEPDFANTVAAMERSGRLLSRTASTFFNLVGADSSDALEAIQTEISPRLARYASQTFTHPALFARVEALTARREGLGLTAEQDRVLYLTHRRFVRAGARLDAAGRARMGEIMQRLAALGTKFSQNVLADERAWSMALEGDDLAGLPDFVLDAARGAASARGVEGHVVTLSRSLIEPFLTFSARRDLREKAWAAWVARGANGGETDTAALIAETLALRAERAALLGYPSYAAYKLDTEMAGSPEAVRGLLERVWTAAKARAGEEAERLRALIAADGANHPLAAWDWRFYAEKLRAQDYALSEGELKPYLQLDRVIEAAFDVAGRLFGLSFAPLPDAPRYHPDVRLWEVTRGGAHVGVFMGDYFNRPSKRSGAWSTSFRSQNRLMGEAPVVLNVMNFARGGDGPALLTWDDARTLFHELGHGLHSLLSNVEHPSVSGTSVSRDFVELPSQLFEHWLGEPQVLARHAVNARGEAMPADLIARLRAAETFNQGFATVEYVGSALVDLALHEGAPPADPLAAEAAALAAIGMPAEVGMRHRSSHFQHVFAGEGYASGYYSYMWSEVMDADAYAAFEEAGDPFDPETARRLEAEILSVGGSRDAAEAWKAFRGRAPEPAAMLKGRGLAA